MRLKESGRRKADRIQNVKSEIRNPKSEIRSLTPLWGLASVIFLIAGVHFAAQWRLPMPVCWMRVLTGIPCPGCGSTRCLIALSRFDVAQAFRFNPMTFTAFILLVLWFLLWTAEQYLHRQWLAIVRQKIQQLPLAVIVPVVVVVNWIYLYFMLPPQ